MGIIKKSIQIIGNKGEVEIIAVFDSGSHYSLIKKPFAEKIATVEELSEKIIGRMADGKTPMTIKYWLNGPVFAVINGYNIGVHELLVAEELSDELLIGAFTMQAWHITLDMEKEDIIINPDRYELN